jgi:hypothetical protein
MCACQWINLRDWGGSISGEQGIGLIKMPYHSYSPTSEELALMKLLKSALAPRGILNPGKVFQGRADRSQVRCEPDTAPRTEIFKRASPSRGEPK